MEKLKFFYSSSVDAVGCDLDTIFSLLAKLKGLRPSRRVDGSATVVDQEGGVSVELIDTAKMEEKEVHDFYISEATRPSVRKQYRIGPIFGTQKKAGCYFGREQPALLVYQNCSEDPVDIFPHVVKGRMVSIEEFLEDTTTKLE